MANTVVLPPVDDGAPSVVCGDDVDVPGDHCWHYRYNRRLSCFSHAVASLTFSQDGKWLVSATRSGHVKIFDTDYWAERAKLEGCRNEEPRVICFSPAQRWLVCMFPSVMHIFQGKPPWHLVQRVPSPIDQATKASSEWICVAFSPSSEVDQPGGRAGQDNHLAGFASKALCVLDYSGGWDDTPKRTACILDEKRPTSIAYTACGWWLVCGYSSGQVQIWNHFSLTLERTLLGHNGAVCCITPSPRNAPYDARFISCGLDNSLRVWHSSGWILEQIAPDTRADKNGIRSCMFSCGGNWVVSVAVEMCVWRVVVSSKGHMELRLHQRLNAVCGAEGLCTAAICSRQDAIAVGSRDGVLGLWTKLSGYPVGAFDQEKETDAIDRQASRKHSSVTPGVMDKPLPTSMMLVRPEGSPPTEADAKEERRSLRNSEWFVRSDLRSLAGSSHALHLPPASRGRIRGGERLASLGRSRGATGEWASKCSTVSPSPLRASMSSMHISSSVRTRLPHPNVQSVKAFGAEAGSNQNSAMTKSNSVPVLSRWRSTSFECEDVLLPQVQINSTIRPKPESQMPWGLGSPGLRHANAPSNATSRWEFGSHQDAELPPIVGDPHSPVRAAILHATRGLVQRISLDPQHIC